MKLVDMKLPKKTKKELKAETVPTLSENQPEYPYGLTFHLDPEEVDKLDVLKKVEADDVVHIQAVGFIKRVSVEDVHGKGEKRHSVDIQIQKIAISTDDAEKAFNEKEE